MAEDDRIWSTEHGPRTGDELNLVKPRANYGWPLVSRGRGYVTNLPIGREMILDGEISRIRSVQQGQDGALYLLQDAPNAGLYHLAPAQ